MGWYLRRAVRLGPVRFNLSRRGVGASVGVPGARVGVDAAGRDYAHLGRGGVYYRGRVRDLRDVGGVARGVGIGVLLLLALAAAVAAFL